MARLKPEEKKAKLIKEIADRKAKLADIEAAEKAKARKEQDKEAIKKLNAELYNIMGLYGFESVEELYKWIKSEEAVGLYKNK